MFNIPLSSNLDIPNSSGNNIMATAVVLSPTLSADLSHSIDEVDNLQSLLHIQVSKPSSVGFEEKLVVSPYSEEPHLLDLDTLDTANQLLAKALMNLKCLRKDYATAPYAEIFNVSDSNILVSGLSTKNYSGPRLWTPSAISLSLHLSAGGVTTHSIL